MHEYYRMLVSAAIDGEATEAELKELEEHIAGCPECGNHNLPVGTAVGDILPGTAGVETAVSLVVLDMDIINPLG